MGLSQLPSPSFVIYPEGSDSMRLPAYKSAYLGRYHPYPRGGPRPLRDLDFDVNATNIPTPVPYNGPRLDWHLVCDFVSSSQRVEAERTKPVIPQEDAADRSLVKLNEVVSSGDEGGRARRLSLSTLVIDLALAIRRRLRILRSVSKEEGVAFDMIL